MRCARAHGAGEGSAALVPNPGSADGDGHALHALQGGIRVWVKIKPPGVLVDAQPCQDQTPLKPPLGSLTSG